MGPATEACPFCGGRSHRVKPLWERYWFVACNNCKAAGPVGNTQDEAVALWNERREPMLTQGELF